MGEMEFRRRSSNSGVINFRSLTLGSSPSVTNSTANLVVMEESRSGNDPPLCGRPKVCVCLKSMATWNIHRLVLAGCVIILGSLVIATVFHSGSTLPAYFGSFHCANIPIASLGLFVFWFKIRKLIQMMTAAIADHHVQAANFRDSQFAGIVWIKWRVHVFIITSWIDVGANIAFIVFQSINLYRANVLFDEEQEDANLETDEMLLALFALVVICGIVSLFSMIHGSFIVTLLFGYFNHVNIMKKYFYPVEIRLNSQDQKPVLLC